MVVHHVAGTLDPMATGLLVVCVGKGTKSSQLLTSEDKTYSGVLRLGEATPSYDSETAVSQTAAWEHLSAEQLQDAATEHFTGHLQQVLSTVSLSGRVSELACFSSSYSLRMLVWLHPHSALMG